jgi:hypothetical protein
MNKDAVNPPNKAASPIGLQSHPPIATMAVPRNRKPYKAAVTHTNTLKAPRGSYKNIHIASTNRPIAAANEPIAPIACSGMISSDFVFLLHHAGQALAPLQYRIQWQRP